MSQFSRPSVDTNNAGSWTNEALGASNLYQGLDESIANDLDYILSVSGPSSAAYTTLMSSVTDPAVSTGHIWRVRYGKDISGGTVNLVTELRQGYVNEGDLGTLIATRTFSGVSNVLATDAYTLSGPEADAITDYTNLSTRVVATQT